MRKKRFIRYHDHTGMSPVDYLTQNTLLCHMRKRCYIRYHEHTGKSSVDHHTPNNLPCLMRKSYAVKLFESTFSWAAVRENGQYSLHSHRRLYA